MKEELATMVDPKGGEGFTIQTWKY